MNSGRWEKNEFIAVEDFCVANKMGKDIGDAIVRLSKCEYATDALLMEFERMVLEKHDLLKKLKPYGIDTPEAASMMALKMGID